MTNKQAWCARELARRAAALASLPDEIQETALELLDDFLQSERCAQGIDVPEAQASFGFGDIEESSQSK